MGDPANTESVDSSDVSGRKRQRSLIEFPYSDLQRAADLCVGLAALAGSGPLDLTQFAASMNQTATGGTFRGRLSSARMFGLIEFGGSEARLTNLGEQIISPDTAESAKVTAFRNVPLYEKAYQQYQGYPLPPAAAIERQMMNWGVPEKQAERARQAFASSVATANFINMHGKFVQPVVSANTGQSRKSAEAATKTGGSDGCGTPPGNGGSAGGGGGKFSFTSKPAKSSSEMLLDLLDPDAMTEQETQAVWTLLLYAKRPKQKVEIGQQETATDQ